MLFLNFPQKNLIIIFSKVRNPKNQQKNFPKTPPTTSQSSSHPFEELLRKLDAERNINSEIYCDENEPVESSASNLLYGIHASEKMNDVLNENVFIELINSQLKLGLEDPVGIKLKNHKSQNSDLSNDQKDYLIIFAARTNVIQRLHKPIWKSQRLLNKTL